MSCESCRLLRDRCFAPVATLIYRAYLALRVHKTPCHRLSALNTNVARVFGHVLFVMNVDPDSHNFLNMI